MVQHFIGVYIRKLIKHYMVPWRYKISLLVLKKNFTRLLHSLMKYFSRLEEKFRICTRPCNILYVFALYYIQLLGNLVILVKLIL